MQTNFTPEIVKRYKMESEMSETVQKRTIGFSDEARTRVSAKGYEGAIKYIEKGEYPGVKFISWEFEDIDGSLKDGALIEIEPGKSTPVQLVESESTFSEVPLSGELIFVSLDSENIISAYRYKSDRDGDNSFMMEVGKGGLMFWHSVAGQEKSTEVLEYEEPGFSASKLTNIEFGQKTIGDREIPEIFWYLASQLEKGDYQNLPIEIIDLSKLTVG